MALPRFLAWAGHSSLLRISHRPGLDQGLGLGRIADGAARPTGGYRYGLLGWKCFLLSGVENNNVLPLFFFTMVAMSIAATIPTGAMAERWAWRNFCLYGIWFVLLFSVYANWVWGGGWLAQSGINWGLGLGVVDCAGSGVIHVFGGVVALAGALAIGPRLGKYQRGRPQPMPGHHVSMVVAGTLVLAIGWFGLNLGCIGVSSPGERLELATVNTAVASAAGAAAAMLTLLAKRMKPDPTIMCNGMLAGLVAISAACPLVGGRIAVFIGAVAGILVVYSVMFWRSAASTTPSALFPSTDWAASGDSWPSACWPARAGGYPARMVLSARSTAVSTAIGANCLPNCWTSASSCSSAWSPMGSSS